MEPDQDCLPFERKSRGLSKMYVSKAGSFDTSIKVDADKSITHRALILGAAAQGKTRIFAPSLCLDCLSTINCLKTMGAKITQEDDVLEISGGVESGQYYLDAQNSGTTARLLMGFLAPRKGITAHLTGDQSLRKRPMSRIITPLKLMGAKITTSCNKEDIEKEVSDSQAFESNKNTALLDAIETNKGIISTDIVENLDTLPATIEGAQLAGVEYDLPVASAQLKSAILIAGLEAEGKTSIGGLLDSRNHTELMLAAMGARLGYTEQRLCLEPSRLAGIDIEPMGDFSSAMYFLVLGLLCRNSQITIRNVNINPTRTAALELLKQSGANIYIGNERQGVEKSADITAQFSKLRPFEITPRLSRQMIDELPLLAAAACFIEGESIISGAQELKVKESNRIQSIAEGLSSLGANIQILPDGLIIRGKGSLSGGVSVSGQGDHRIEMSLAIAAALSNNGAEIRGGRTQISFPSFYPLLKQITNS